MTQTPIFNKGRETFRGVCYRPCPDGGLTDVIRPKHRAWTKIIRHPDRQGGFEGTVTVDHNAGRRDRPLVSLHINGKLLYAFETAPDSIFFAPMTRHYFNLIGAFKARQPFQPSDTRPRLFNQGRDGGFKSLEPGA